MQVILCQYIHDIIHLHTVGSPRSVEMHYSECTKNKKQSININYQDFPNPFRKRMRTDQLLMHQSF